MGHKDAVLAKVLIDGDCWMFQGQKHSKGYGRIRHKGKWLRAHRIVYEETFGPIPAGMFVCHHCDRPGCVNPAHLFLGSPADNMADKTKKARGLVPYGDDHFWSKLTAPKVKEIRKRHSAFVSQLAEEFGLSRSGIANVLGGKTWKQVLGDE